MFNDNVYVLLIWLKILSDKERYIAIHKSVRANFMPTQKEKKWKYLKNGNTCQTAIITTY